ncbi:hypothetical protein KY362_03265 [Candidatus Woesearchaeota archaeon]|nr:hypothetical protein [Candidatus Woesearchaeota archaeon]
MQTTKLAHNIRLSVFAKEHEDPAKIADALIDLCPFELEKEKVGLKKSKAQGFNEKIIIIFEIVLEKQRHIRQFIEHLKSILSEDQRNLILRQKESRLDDDMNFFIRIDKPRWLEERRAWITDSGDCFHIRMTIAAYPAKKENAFDVIKAWLKSA